MSQYKRGERKSGKSQFQSLLPPTYDTPHINSVSFQMLPPFDDDDDDDDG